MPSSTSFGHFAFDWMTRARAANGATLTREMWQDSMDVCYHQFQQAQAGYSVAPSVPNGTGHLVQYTPDELEALRLRICAFKRFNRRPDTKWTDKELKSLRKLFPYHPDDLTMVEARYNAGSVGDDYRRREIFTLLNNWSGEVDLARTWFDAQKRALITATTSPSLR